MQSGVFFNADIAPTQVFDASVPKFDFDNGPAEVFPAEKRVCSRQCRTSVVLINCDNFVNFCLDQLAAFVLVLVLLNR